eukprot:9920-Heterococcus_DN1.PRE.1
MSRLSSLGGTAYVACVGLPSSHGGAVADAEAALLFACDAAAVGAALGLGVCVGVASGSAVGGGITLSPLTYSLIGQVAASATSLAHVDCSCEVSLINYIITSTRCCCSGSARCLHSVACRSRTIRNAAIAAVSEQQKLPQELRLSTTATAATAATAAATAGAAGGQDVAASRERHAQEHSAEKQQQQPCSSSACTALPNVPFAHSWWRAARQQAVCDALLQGRPLPPSPPPPPPPRGVCGAKLRRAQSVHAVLQRLVQYVVVDHTSIAGSKLAYAVLTCTRLSTTVTALSTEGERHCQ